MKKQITGITTRVLTAILSASLVMPMSVGAEQILDSQNSAVQMEETVSDNTVSANGAWQAEEESVLTAERVGEIVEKDGIVTASIYTYVDGKPTEGKQVLDLKTGVLTITGSGTLECGGLWFDSNYRLKVKTIIIEEGISELRAVCFASAGPDESLPYTKVILPNSLKVIEEDAFAGSMLTELRIPSSVEIIRFNPCGACPMLKEYIVDPGNTQYGTVDGVLYEKSNMELIAYPDGCGKSFYSVPDSIKTIREKAFFYTQNLTEISIPANVSIDELALCVCIGLKNVEFRGKFETDFSCGMGMLVDCFELECLVFGEGDTTIPSEILRGNSLSKVKTISLPKSLTSIPLPYLCNFDKLETVFFAGTEEQWNELTEGKTIFSSKVDPAKITMGYDHVHQYKEMVVRKKATVSADGSKEYVCTCGAKKEEVIPSISQMILSVEQFVYNGQEQVPQVTVKDRTGVSLADANYTVSVTGDKKSVGQKTVTVTFKGDLYEGTLQKTYTIVAEPQVQTQKITVKGTSISKVTPLKKGFKVVWKKKTKGINGYQLQYSISKKFKKGKSTKSVTVKKIKTNSKKVTKLKSKKTYYVRIRTYKNVKENGKTKKVYSAWSKAKKVKTK